ncbi:MAG: DUF4397 domain-containing protein [Sediminibacterium sp.]|nr:DUF4397 domain-containing protein [Sediminibacterium sp.]MBX9780955.1 DUF4397 domain-containing protein [Chitinophagaceae bacterium]
MKKNIFLLLSTVLVLIFSGCAKDPENLGYSKIMAVNTTPNRTNVDVFLDGIKANITPLGFGSNSIYYGVTPGSRGISVMGNITTSFLVGTTIFTTTSSSLFQQGNFDIKRNDATTPSYTLVIANRAETPELVLIEDDLTVPAAGKAGLRLIHAGPDAPRVNAYNGAATTPIFSATNGYGFKEYTGFTPIDALSTGSSYSIQIRNNTTGAILRTQTLTAVSGKLYTIILRGLVTADPLYPTNTLSSTLIGNN